MAPRSRVLTLALVALTASTVGSCGDDDTGSDGAVEVSDAWARSSPPGVTDGAAYMTIESAADDQLIGASVPADVADSTGLHATVTAAGQGADDTTGADMAGSEGVGETMTMQHVSVVDLPSGEAVVFEPGGLHVMLFDLVRPLEAGSSFELTLTFANAEPQRVTVDIRDEAP